MRSGRKTFRQCFRNLKAPDEFSSDGRSHLPFDHVQSALANGSVMITKRNEHFRKGRLDLATFGQLKIPFQVRAQYRSPRHTTMQSRKNVQTIQCRRIRIHMITRCRADHPFVPATILFTGILGDQACTISTAPKQIIPRPNSSASLRLAR